MGKITLSIHRDQDKLTYAKQLYHLYDTPWLWMLNSGERFPTEEISSFSKHAAYCSNIGILHGNFLGGSSLGTTHSCAQTYQASDGVILRHVPEATGRETYNHASCCLLLDPQAVILRNISTGPGEAHQFATASPSPFAWPLEAKWGGKILFKYSGNRNDFYHSYPCKKSPADTTGQILAVILHFLPLSPEVNQILYPFVIGATVFAGI